MGCRFLQTIDPGFFSEILKSIELPRLEMGMKVDLSRGLALLLLSIPGFVVSGDITRVERADGTTGNGSSLFCTLSGNGRFVAFESDANNLVLNDQNGKRDIFVFDRDDMSFDRVSIDSMGVAADDSSQRLAISENGRWVAFSSQATNLVTGDTNGRRDIFVHDRITGDTERVSIGTGESGPEGDLDSSACDISDDGRFVVFATSATTFSGFDTNGVADIYVRDRLLHLTTRVSLKTGGAQGDAGSSDPRISGDGRYITFSSDATNLVDGDIQGEEDVFLHDRMENTTIRISENAAGEGGNARNSSPEISADGGVVGFISFADNLADDDENERGDLYLYEVETRFLTRVNNDVGGAEPNNSVSGRCSFSREGRFVGISSRATNLTETDENGQVDVFVFDRMRERTFLISETAEGSTGNSDSQFASLSDDGKLIAFGSSSSNLIPGDLNGVTDIFVAAVPDNSAARAALLKRIRKLSKRVRKGRKLGQREKVRRLKQKIRKLRVRLIRL